MFLGVGSGCDHANRLESCIRHPSDSVGNYHTEITVQTQKLPYSTDTEITVLYSTVQTQKLPYSTDTEISVAHSTVQTQKLPYSTDTEMTVH